MENKDTRPWLVACYRDDDTSIIHISLYKIGFNQPSLALNKYGLVEEVDNLAPMPTCMSIPEDMLSNFQSGLKQVVKELKKVNEKK